MVALHLTGYFRTFQMIADSREKRFARLAKMKLHWVAFILVLWPSATLQRSSVDSPTYVAGIVDYSPVLSSDGEDDVGRLNAINYLNIIDTAITYAVDIIVFPESSLSDVTAENATVARSQGASYIPDPADKVAPCDDKRYEYSLSSISCSAKQHKIYVLINHREKVDCTPRKDGCPADGFLIYNTNVAFDRNGQVVARYRKYHLFGEYEKNITDQAVPTTFETDFGVTFGTFICFDLLFQAPTLNLTRDLKVTDILYSTHWFSELPYLYAVEAQAAWAYANDVNFLASSLNYPKTASGGGGIFLGKQGHVQVVSTNKRSNTLVVAEIPKLINGKRTQNIDRTKVNVYEFTNKEITTGENLGDRDWTYLRDDLSVYSSEPIDVKQKSFNKIVCDRGFCCTFKGGVDFDENSIKNHSIYYHYRFAVFNGTRTFGGVATGGVKTCGIIACLNDSSLDSCGRLFEKETIAPTVFTSLEISSADVPNENIFFVPVTFSQRMMPLNVTDFTFQSVSADKYASHRMELTKPLNNLLTFAIYGRDFSRDGTEVTRNISSALAISPILLFVAIANYIGF